jgi:hypothetical protein
MPRRKHYSIAKDRGLRALIIKAIMTINMEEFSETRAIKEDLIETSYIGSNPTLVGTNGEAYYDLKNQQWFYRITGTEDFFRVHAKSLECNNEKGLMRCEYVGLNKLASGDGKAFFDEDENIWMFKPTNGKELFRVKNEKSLKFRRDEEFGGGSENSLDA